MTTENDDLVKRLREIIDKAQNELHTFERVGRQTSSDLLVAAIQAADHLSAQGEPVEVEPLEWGDSDSCGSMNGRSGRRIMERARHPFGAYFIEEDPNTGASWLTQGLLGDEIGGPFEQIWQTRAAAQADYEQRIRSALIDAPQASSAVPPGWELVPIDITEEMWDAFFKARDEVFPEMQAAAQAAGRGWKGLPAVIWEELLSAAPTPPAALSQTKEGENG